jgi:monoamine oxidase
MSDTTQTIYDVLVVGAGLAGLMAAYECQRRGLSVLVLEGRDRVGGRCLTRTAAWKGAPTWFDFGAHFIGDDTKQQNIWALVRDLGLKTFPQYEGPDDPNLKWAGQGANLLADWSGGKTGPEATSAYIGSIYPDSWGGLFRMAELEVLLKEMEWTGPDWFADKSAYDLVSVGGWVESLGYRRDSELYKLLDMLCHVGFSADADDISMLWFLFYISSSGGLDAFSNLRFPTQGAQGYRLVKGTMSIAEELAGRLTARAPGSVALGKTVKRLDFSAETGSAICRDGSRYAFRKAVVALSPQLANLLDVTPALPQSRRDAAQAMRNGQTVMTVMHFKKPFWREDRTRYPRGLYNGTSRDDISANGLSGNALLIGAPIVWTMDNTSYEGAPAMFAFVVGKWAEHWDERPEAERVKLVGSALGSLYGMENVNASFTGYEEKLWTVDPYSQGCPTGHFGPGAYALWSEVLLQSDTSGSYFGGRLHFASTESAMVSNGYMSGAIWAGQTVADRLAP